MKFVSHVLVRCVKQLSALFLSLPLGSSSSPPSPLSAPCFSCGVGPVNQDTESRIWKKRLGGPEGWGQGARITRK